LGIFDCGKERLGIGLGPRLRIAGTGGFWLIGRGIEGKIRGEKIPQEIVRNYLTG
jgi:hypothetical protein